MSLWNAYHRPPDDPALRFKEPDLLIQKAEANLRNAEANLKKKTSDAETLLQQVNAYEADWSSGLNSVLAACTLKDRKETSVMDKKTGKYKSVVSLTLKIKKGLEEIPPEAHGTQLA